ncbi:hypothetical protein PV328_006783 [Microctonus aethiopoides]|uniref:Peptidase M12B domain-containing protein n=1 Tax=Microctonus aethiopoides TaxID=144406 RepID=A0AA39FQ33_9HYME|nr:hypothetical protein PV328_006783 [Microctonus aethiopoides]
MSCSPADSAIINLTNENLPVWTANLSPDGSSVKHKLKPNLIKEDIGEFVMYHDVEQSSAVVYFKKLNVLQGIIDTRYIIDGLPYTELNQVHIVDGPYVKKTLKIEDHDKLSDPSIPHDQINFGPSTSSQDKPSKKRPTTSSEDEPLQKRPSTQCTTSHVPTLYPEILVFVAYDVIQFTKTVDSNNYLASIVRRYLIYFNAVDMLFAKLSAHGINIHINIAGIVIDESNIFPMVKSSFPTPSNIPENDLRFDGRALEANHYIARLSETTYDYLEGAISHYGYSDDFVTAAHEISHLLSVTHDPTNEGICDDGIQCYSIMKERGGFCQNCLKWSDQSIEEIKKYATKNRNHCYLLNTPRSLHPYGVPVRGLAPSTQCLCYGFQPRLKTSLRDLVPASNCNKKLVCENMGPYGNTHRPLDGTPCGDLSKAKVCWKRKCQEIPNTATLTYHNQLKPEKPMSAKQQYFEADNKSFLFHLGQEEVLEVIIKDGETEIHLKWKKTNQLANKHLPVWTTNLSPFGIPIKHELQSTIMNEEIGEFVMYHDVEQSSAVVYFKKLNTLHGIIDTRYRIDGLPFTELNQVHLVNGPYVKGLKKSEYRSDHTKPLDLSISRNQIDCGPSTSSQYELSKKRPTTSSEDEPPAKRPNSYCTTPASQGPTLYPEILVFVTYDRTQSAKTKDPNNYLAMIVKEYLIYFNAVDMLFAKLSAHDINIRINIAGIVIDKDNVLPLMKSQFPPPPETFRDDVCIDTVNTLDSMKNYIKKNAKLFVEDSFDLFFVSTGFVLQRNDYVVRGTSLPANVYDARVSKTTYSNLLGAISEYGKPDDYVVAAHEITHTFDIGHDPENKGFYNYYMQCYSIMTQKGKFCQDCLKWSDKNIADFKKFTTENRNRCYLLNTPRSLHPYGVPIRSLWPSIQCLCYGFQTRRSTNELPSEAKLVVEGLYTIDTRKPHEIRAPDLVPKGGLLSNSVHVCTSHYGLNARKDP